MAFTWTTIESETTTAKKTHMNEISQAVKNLAGSNKINISFTWDSGYDPFSKDKIETINLTKIRKAIDGLSDYNYCRNHRNGHKGIHWPIHRSTEEGSQKTGYCGTHRYDYEKTNNYGRNTSN